MEKIWLTYRSEKWSFKNGFSKDIKYNKLISLLTDFDQLEIINTLTSEGIQLILIGEDDILKNASDIIIKMYGQYIILHGNYGIQRSSKKGFKIFVEKLKKNNMKLSKFYLTRILFAFTNILSVGLVGEEFDLVYILKKP